jgi:hypothetical protein
LLSREPTQRLKIEDLSATQYNVLPHFAWNAERLRGGEISSSMITRTLTLPDSSTASKKNAASSHVLVTRRTAGL